MEKVILKPIYHRNADCIGIYFKKNDRLQNAIQNEVSAKWSHTKSCWYVTLSEKNYKLLAAALLGKAIVETGELRKHLIEKKKSKSVTIPSEEKKIVDQKKVVAKEIKKIANTPITNTISQENVQALEDYSRHLILKGYSKSTIRTYTNEFKQFLDAIKNESAKGFSESRIKDYLQYCIVTLKLSENTLHSRINALKFYYEHLLGREKFFLEIPRPKKQHLLPKIFSQDEIAAIINSIKNTKHKAMVMLAYSAGLRVSEVVSLKTYQVDSKRMTLFISQAKGKKDRIVALSPVLLVILREYAMEYKPNKKEYLFEGREAGKPYTVRSLQEVLSAAKKKAGVIRPGSIHSLRHSFATHLIERGTDVTMIQKLLGHNDLKTTLIYLHTSNKDLVKIISPLDDLKLI
jgi:site-specific recombinase XerD